MQIEWSPSGKHVFFTNEEFKSIFDLLSVLPLQIINENLNKIITEIINFEISTERLSNFYEN